MQSELGLVEYVLGSKTCCPEGVVDLGTTADFSPLVSFMAHRFLRTEYKCRLRMKFKLVQRTSLSERVSTQVFQHYLYFSKVSD